MTIVKHCTTMPPTTQMGMEANAAPSFPMTPNTMSQPAHAKPAERDAQRVSAMTPLFWLKVVFGGDVKMHARSRVDAVGEQAALRARFEIGSLGRDHGRLARHRDIADSLGRAHKVPDKNGQEVRAVEADRKRRCPQEREPGASLTRKLFQYE